MTLPGTATIPAVHADRLRAAEASGTRAVGLAAEGLKPSAIVTEAAIDNALRVLLAIGGSTNGVLHLAAIAGRAGIELPLDKLNRLSDETPVPGRSQADRSALHGGSLCGRRSRPGPQGPAAPT